MTYGDFAEYENHYEKPYEEILGANTAVIGYDDEYISDVLSDGCAV